MSSLEKPGFERHNVIDTVDFEHLSSITVFQILILSIKSEVIAFFYFEGITLPMTYINV